MHGLQLAVLLAFFCTTCYLVEGQGLHQQTGCGGQCQNGVCRDFFGIVSVCLCYQGYSGDNCDTDTAAPTLVCPETQYGSTDPGTNHTTVTFGPESNADNSDSEPSLEMTPKSGSLFYYGETEVQIRSSDNAGNVAVCNFTVHVEDHEPPVIICPSDMTYYLENGEMRKVVEFAVESVNDNVDRNVNVTSSPKSGSEFSLGPNVVQMSAVDGSGNVANCTFTITVFDMLTCEDGSTFGIGGECNYIWDCSDGSDEYHCEPDIVDEMISLQHPSNENATWKFQVEEGLGIHITFRSNYSRVNLVIGEGTQPGKYELYSKNFIYNDLDIFLPSNIVWVVFTTGDDDYDSGLAEILVESTDVTSPISISDESYVLNRIGLSDGGVYLWKVNVLEGKWIGGSIGETASRYGYRTTFLIRDEKGGLFDLSSMFGPFEEFLIPEDVIWIEDNGYGDFMINVTAQEPTVFQVPVGRKYVVSYSPELRASCSFESFVIELPESVQFAMRLRNTSIDLTQKNIVMFEENLAQLTPVGALTLLPSQPTERSLVTHLTKSKIVVIFFPNYNCLRLESTLNEAVFELEFKPENLNVQLDDGDVFSMSSAQTYYSEKLFFNRRVFTSDNDLFVETKVPFQPCTFFYNGSFPKSLFLQNSLRPLSFQSSLLGVSTQDLGILSVDLQSSPFDLGCSYDINIHPSVPNDGYVVCADGKSVATICNTVEECPCGRDETNCVPQQVGYLTPVNLVATPATVRLYTFQKSNDADNFVFNARLLSSYGSFDQEALIVGSGPYLGNDSSVIATIQGDDLRNEGKVLIFEDNVIWIKMNLLEARYPLFGTLSVGSSDDYFNCGNNVAVVSDSVCDGLQHCPSGADEMNCAPLRIGDYLSLAFFGGTSDFIWSFTSEEGSGFEITLDNSIRYRYNYIAIGYGTDPSDNSSIIFERRRNQALGGSITVGSNTLWILMRFQYSSSTSPGAIEVRNVTGLQTCANKLVLEEEDQCNGLHDCSDGSDEVGCSPLPTSEEVSLVLPSRSRATDVIIWSFRAENGSLFLLNLARSVRYDYHYIAVGTGPDPSINTTIIREWNGYENVEDNVIIPDNVIWLKMEPAYSLPRSSPGSVYVARINEFNVTEGAIQQFSSPSYPLSTSDNWVGFWIYKFPEGMGGLIQCADLSLNSGTIEVGAGEDFDFDRSIVTLIDHYSYNSAEIQIPYHTVWIKAVLGNNNAYYRPASRFRCSVTAVDVTVVLLANESVEIEHQAEDDQFVWSGWAIETPDAFSTLFSFEDRSFTNAGIGVGINIEENTTAEYFFSSYDPKRDVAIDGPAWTYLSSRTCYSLCSWSYTVSAVDPEALLSCGGYIYTEDDVCNNVTTCISGTDENDCVTARIQRNETILLYPPSREETDLIWSIVVEAGLNPLLQLKNTNFGYRDTLLIGSGIWQAGKSPLASFDQSNSSFDVLISSDSAWVRYTGAQRSYYRGAAFELEVSAVEADDFFQCTESVVVVNSTLVCDGQPNCPYGDDEIGCEIATGEFATLLTTDYPAGRPADIMQKWEYHTTEDNLAMIVHFRELFLSYSEGFYAGTGQLSPEYSSVYYRPAQDCYFTPYDPVEDLYLESNMIWINIASEYFLGQGSKMWAEVRVVKSNDDFIRCNDSRHIAALDQLCDNLWTCEDGEDEIGCDGVSIDEGEIFSLEFPRDSTFHEDTVRSWTFTTQRQDSVFAITFTNNGYYTLQVTAGKGNDFMAMDSVVESFQSSRESADIFILGSEGWLLFSGTVVDVSINVTVVPLSELYICEGSERVISRDKVCDNTWDCRSGSDESTCEPTSLSEVDNYVFSLRRPYQDTSSTFSWIFEIPDGMEASVELRSLNLHRAHISIGSGHDPSNINTRLFATIDDVDIQRLMIPVKQFWVKTVVDTRYSTLRGTVEIKSIPPIPNTCADDEFQCTLSRECIGTTLTCDGNFDCEDRSDEISCDCASPVEIRCGTGECISRDSICGGYAYSIGAACIDEDAFCDFECSSWEGSRFISNRFICDGFRDCVDGLDEEVENCECKPPAYSCGDKCITPNQVCDGVNDCQDGRDESDCECSSFELACEEADCIAYWDGCMEEVCMNADECKVCPPSHFQCQDYTCLPASSVCNFVRDCLDGEDEEGCNYMPTVRLVGGNRANEGRVEVFYDGVWGTVCDDSWDDRDASVVCRQLGFGDSGDAFSYAYFGRGNGPIWLDNVRCTGNENRLEECSNYGWGNHNCGHSEDAGVRCEYDMEIVRLVGGNTTYEGRVEVYYNGEWGTICDDDWDETDATVVCRQLGLGNNGEALRLAAFGSGVGPIWLDNVACIGYERGIDACRANDWGDHNCGHYEDASVRCYNDLTTLPEDITTTMNFDDLTTLPPAIPTIPASDAPCSPNPCRNGGICLALGDSYMCFCPTTGTLGPNCELDSTTLSPANPSTTTLFAYCDPNPCRNGGFCIDLSSSFICLCSGDSYGEMCEFISTTLSPANPSTTTLFDYNDDVEPTTTSSNAAYCDPNPCRNGGLCIDLSSSFICLCSGDSYGEMCEFSSNNYYDFSTVAYNEGDFMTTGVPFSFDVILDADSSYTLTSPGYPESLPDLKEGTWTISAPEGYGIQAEILDVDVGYDSRFQLGSGSTVGRNVITDFDGYSTSGTNVLVLRSSTVWFTFASDSYSSYRGFVAILRAVEGIGISNIYYLLENETTTIESPNYPENYPVKVDEIWNFEAAEGLGFEVTFSDFSLEENWDYVSLGQGNEPYLNALTTKLTGYSIPETVSFNENSLWLRFTSDLSNTSRGFRANVKAVAAEVTRSAVRLVGGSSEYEGRVEIFHDGEWGTVCDDSWDRYDAQVVCRELGLGEDGVALSYGRFGEGIGPIWLDEVRCRGHELRLEDCITSGWGVHDCTHQEDAGVRCQGDFFATTEISVEDDTVNLESNSPRRIDYYGSYGYNNAEENWNIFAPDNHSIQISFTSFYLNDGQLEVLIVLPNDDRVPIASYTGNSIPEDTTLSSSSIVLTYIPGYRSYGSDSFRLTVTAVQDSVEECESDTIPSSFRCNGKPECRENIDEANCDFSTNDDGTDESNRSGYFVRIGSRYGSPCGGALINSRWVVTAAECLNQRSTTDYVVVVGLDDFPANYTEYDTYGAVAEIEVNTPNGSESGIGLLKLDRPVEGFAIDVFPISLPRNGSVLTPGTYVNVVGWSRTLSDEAEAFITTIREPVVSDEFCRTRRYPPNLMGGAFCTGYIQSYRADCFNIYGGPVVYEDLDDGRPELVGVVIRQPYPWQCGQSFAPKVHPLVSSHVGFITDIMRYV